MPPTLKDGVTLEDILLEMPHTYKNRCDPLPQNTHAGRCARILERIQSPKPEKWVCPTFLGGRVCAMSVQVEAISNSGEETNPRGVVGEGGTWGESCFKRQDGAVIRMRVWSRSNQFKSDSTTAICVALDMALHASVSPYIK